jgi:hypothetical protein
MPMRKFSAQKAEPVFNPVLPSNLIGQLFELAKPEYRLLVVDMGYPSPATVQFFNQYRCRLEFLDLINTDFLSLRPVDAEQSVLVEYFQAGLNLQPGAVIDICLFWDIFNYLDHLSVQAFMQALRPYIHSSSQGYSLGVLSGRNRLPFCQYGIDSQASLSQAQLSGQQPEVYNHSQRDLNSLLSYFEVDKSRLMPDGRVEYLLRDNLLPRPVKPAIF